MRRFAVTAALMLAAPALTTAQEPASAPQLRPAFRNDTAARREIAELRAELARIAASGPRNTAQLAAAREKLQALNVRETALAVRLGEDRNRLARLLSALQLFRRHPPPALLVSPEDARDAVRAAILIRAMTPELERRAGALTAEARSMAALRREAAAANAELFTTESTLAEQTADIERLLESEAAQGLFAASPGAMVASLAPGGSNGTLGGLAPPVAGPLVRPYGAVLSAGGRSPGVAFAAPRGSVVRAPAPGVVEFAAPVTGWGVVLILRSAGGHHLVLGGLAEASVAPGQSVASGTPVGRMTNEGQSDPELYLEVRRGGVPINPSRLLVGASRPTTVR
jgi:septal ring factor EnvC (AmiA/AmiB activator)